MPITAGDIKLLKTQVMDDVPEGGGAPTAAIVPDAASNSVFPDISELDRSGGRVNLRKLAAGVRTADVDGFYGVNLIVAEPPKDPRVSVTLFTTGDTFDRRAAAAARMEAYLSRGPAYAGYLFGDHLAGQASVTLLQRSEVQPPVIGDTLVLRKNEGLSTQFDQYIRVTRVTTTERTFTDSQGDFKRTQVVLELSDTLQADFNGFDALRLDASINFSGKTKVSSTIVADAARYFGVVPLQTAASLGDFTVKATGIFTQLVPSTRAEIPIADARMNQRISAGVDAGGAINVTPTLPFTSAQPMFLGGAIVPGSLTIARSGITLTDKGGVLLNGGTAVGTVDYGSGIAQLSSNLFGTTSGAHAVNYRPATPATLVTDTLGLPVTKEGQRLNWVFTLDPVPVKGTLQVSYLALGKWYTLADDGSGALRGSDSSFGAGTINLTTGTVSVTLGAMPDVGSRVMSAYASAAPARPIASLPPTTVGFTRRAERLMTVGKSIKAGGVTLSWNDGAPRTSTDDGGVLVGDARGTVYYGAGEIHFSPNVLPAPGTVVSLVINETVHQEGFVSAFTDAGAAWSFTLPAPIQPKSLEVAVLGKYSMRSFPGTEADQVTSLRVVDDGSGVLQIDNGMSYLVVGTVNYATGSCSITKQVAGFNSTQPVYLNRAPLAGAGDPMSFVKLTSWETRTLQLTLLNGSGSDLATVVSWAWWTGGRQTTAAEYRYGSNDAAAAQSYQFAMDQVSLDIVDPYQGSSGMVLTGQVRALQLGTDLYVVQGSNVFRNPSPLNGLGTAAGFATPNRVVLTDWPTGASAVPSAFTGALLPAVSEVGTAQLVDNVTLRTAVAPLLNGGFEIAGAWSDGSTFHATADNAGIVSSGTAAVGTAAGTWGVFGTVDYEMGIVDLRFGRRMPAGSTGPDIIDASSLGVPGVGLLQSRGVQADTLRYNAVGYSYLPLNPAILGLNPVRLPPDGRVPIFRKGSFVVVGNTQTVGPAELSAGQVINCGRERLSRVRLLDKDGLVIPGGYSADLDSGLVTVIDPSGWAQPVELEHRIEDMVLVSDVQINGQISFTRPLTHNYPVQGTFVASALVAGDVRARVSLVLDQKTWTNEWSDALIGASADATYNDAQNPLVVTNRSALTERWAIKFTSNTAFDVIGEHVGVIATGNTGADCSPTNPETGQPYFTIRSAGWGAGWVQGNVLRINTIGALVPVWVARTILQGPETVANDSFALLVRGDVDRP